MTVEQIQEMDKDQLFNKDNLIEIFQEDSEFDIAMLCSNMLDRAKELGCARGMQSLIKAFRQDVKNNTRVSTQVNNTCYFEPVHGELNCGSWLVDDNGVRVLTVLGEKTVCYHQIIPVERLFNLETHTEKITLAYKKGNSWKEITVDKGLIASSNKIVKLADYGISVTSETAKFLVQYLNDIENINEIPCKNSTSKFGWSGDDFIPFDTKIVFDNESRFKELADSLKECGSFEIWLDLCKKIRANKNHYEPRAYMAASFASVLVSPLNMLPFILNIYGKTGGGKTVSMMLAASIWADPGENRYITDSYATQNAFEIRLDILNNLPLMIDDFSKIRDKMGDNFTDLIYLLCSGKGKDRSNVDLGLNKVKTWSNTILSNMERPLATETMRGGAINRIIDCEMQPGDIFENGNQVVETIKDNYGYAGYLFVEIIRKLGIPQIKEMRMEFEQKIKDEAIKQNSPKEEKQILPLSLLLTADKIATDYIFKDGIYLDLSFMVGQLKDIREVSEGYRAYNVVMDYVEVYQAKFSDKTDYKPESWGYEEDGYINIVPMEMNRIAKEQNFSVKMLCAWAKEKGLLKSNNDKNQNVIFLKGVSKRFYTIKIGYDETFAENRTNTGLEGFSEVENLELPFD